MVTFDPESSHLQRVVNQTSDVLVNGLLNAQGALSGKTSRTPPPLPLPNRRQTAELHVSKKK
jgi:hypothetical protein